MKLKLREILFTIIAWVIVLTLINFLCGLVVKNTYIAVDPINEKTAKTSYGYFAPNQEKVILFPGLKPYKVTINSLGLRSVGLGKNFSLESAKDKYKILCLGDSMTFGLFVDDEDSYPFRLQNILSQKDKDAIVLNAGIGSATISDYLYYLKIKGLAMKPDLVAISFCANDLTDLARKKPLYESIKDDNVFSLAKTIKLAKFMRVFRKKELAYRYRRSTNKIKDEKVKKALMNESKDLNDILRVAAFASGKTATDPKAEEFEDAWKLYFANVKETADLFKKEKIDFIYIIYPDILTVFYKTKSSYQDMLREFLDAEGIKYIDLLPIFKERRDQYLELYNNLPRDFHLSGLGSQILAEEFYRVIKNRIK